MQINLENLVKMSKIISGISDNFIILDLKSDSIYCSDDLKALKIQVSIDERSSIPAFVFSKSQFQNIISYASSSKINTLTLKDDYSYSIGSMSGKFETNENFLDELESLLMYFCKDKELIFKSTDSLLNDFSLAISYANSDRMPNIYVKDKIIASSTGSELFYSDTTEEIKDTILPTYVVKFLLTAKKSIEDGFLYKTSDGFYYEKDFVTIFFTQSANASFIPVFSDEDNLRIIYNRLKDLGTSYSISSYALGEALAYMKVYFEKEINSKLKINVKGNTINFSSKENYFDFPITNTSNTDYEFTVNAKNLEKLVGFFGKEDVALNLYVNNEDVPYLIKIGQYSFILARIV